MTRRAVTTLVVAAVLPVLLVACTPAAPAATRSSSTPSASPSAQPCDGLELTPGSSLPGPELGACLEARMDALGSFRSDAVATNSQTRTSVASVELDPFRVYLVSDDDDEPREVYLVDNGSWGRFGDAWVPGSLDPSDERGTLVTYQAVLALGAYKPSSIADFVASAPAWVVGESGVEQTAEGAPAWVLTPTASPSLLGIPVTDSSLAVSADFALSRTSGTALFRDEQTTTTQRYSAWGASLDFPPAPTG